jgi:hypothetical protein
MSGKPLFDYILQRLCWSTDAIYDTVYNGFSVSETDISSQAPLIAFAITKEYYGKKSGISFVCCREGLLK